MIALVFSHKFRLKHTLGSIILFKYDNDDAGGKKKTKVKNLHGAMSLFILLLSLMLISIYKNKIGSVTGAYPVIILSEERIQLTPLSYLEAFQEFFAAIAVSRLNRRQTRDAY